MQPAAIVTVEPACHSQHGKGILGASKPKKGSKRKLLEESIKMKLLSNSMQTPVEVCII